MLEVKIPEQFLRELVDYFMSKPMSEAEVAVNNLRHFYDKALKEKETEAHGHGSETKSAS